MVWSTTSSRRWRLPFSFCFWFYWRKSFWNQTKMFTIYYDEIKLLTTFYWRYEHKRLCSNEIKSFCLGRSHWTPQHKSFIQCKYSLSINRLFNVNIRLFEVNESLDMVIEVHKNQFVAPYNACIQCVCSDFDNEYCQL